MAAFAADAGSALAAQKRMATYVDVLKEGTMARKLLISATVFMLVLFGIAAYAQSGSAPQAAPPALTRKVLQTSEYPGDQYKTIEIYGELAPHAFAPWHTHPGMETGYLIDGQGDLMVKGQPVRHMKPGDSWQTPADTPHAVQNTGDAPIKFVSVYVVDKSKPLATPAQAPQ